MARYLMMRKKATDLWKGFAVDLRLVRFLETKEPEPKPEELGGLTREEYNGKYLAYQEELREFRHQAREELARKKEEAEQQLLADNAKAAFEKKQAKRKKDKEKLKSKRDNMRKEEERMKLTKERKEESFRRESIRRKMLEKEEDKLYAELLQQSRTWITEDKLDERIKKALDQIVPLH